MSMKVSVITVVYNGEHFIARAVDSVLKQTHADFEYIVIDGASTDNTMSILKSYGSKITAIISEPDNSLYDAMNKGIVVATGDVVGLLNSDDFYVNNRVLARVVQSFEQDSVDSVYGDLDIISPKDTSKVLRKWRSRPYTEGLFKKGWHPAHPTLFIKKSIYQKYGLFDTRYSIGSDYELMLRVFEKYKISSTYIPEVLVAMHSGGISNASINNIIRSNIDSYHAWQRNGLRIGIFTIFLKMLSKVVQFK